MTELWTRFRVSSFRIDQHPPYSVQSCLILCYPHGLQLARLVCPSPSTRACSNSCPLSQWCHPTILSSIVPFSSCLQSFPASFPSNLFQGVSTSHQVTKVLESQLQHQSLGKTGWISLQSKGLSRVFSNTTVQKHQFFDTQLSLWFNSHLYMTTGKNIALARQTLSLLLNILSRLVITFLPRSRHLLISWLQSPSAVNLEPPQIFSLFPLFPHLFAMKWWGWMPWS